MPEVCQLVNGRTGTRTCFSVLNPVTKLCEDVSRQGARCLPVPEASTPRAGVSRNLSTSPSQCGGQGRSQYSENPWTAKSEKTW